MVNTENFTKQKINEQLERVLSSPAFKNSRVLSGFLEFVIGETLAAREKELKEYTIGIHVLSRSLDFNPQLDAIVRIHAGRLRRALKEYYYEEGKNDLIRIEISKGGYVPSFHANDTLRLVKKNETIKPTSSKSTIAVLPFRNISKDSSRDFFADGLGEQLSTDLTRFNDLSVISYYSSRHVTGKTSDVKEIGMLLNAKYILTGSIQNDDEHLRVSAQLISGDTGEQLWTKSFERSNTSSGLFEIQSEIVRGILTAIGGYYGAIVRNRMKAPNSDHGNGMQVYDAIFLYYHYQKVSSKEEWQKTISALEAAVKADPNYALAWAMLGELYLDDRSLEFRKIDNALEEGLKCALRAVSIDPNCQHGYLALAWNYLFRHNKEEFLKAVDQCLAINSNAADMVGAMGFGLTCAGDFERGFELLNDSVKNNPFFPWWFNSGFAFYFLQKKEYQVAFHWAEKVHMPELFWDPMLKATTLGHLNRIEEAGKYLTLLTQLIPDIATQVKNIIESFLLSQELKNEILEGLRKAGLSEGQQVLGIQLES